MCISRARVENFAAHGEYAKRIYAYVEMARKSDTTGKQFSKIKNNNNIDNNNNTANFKK
jgi:hypothetical protein